MTADNSLMTEFEKLMNGEATVIDITNTPEPIPYKFLGYYFPPHVMPGLQLYINERINPGHFLTAVICNDLNGAFTRADSECMANMPAIVAYLYNEAPGTCWGSPEKMEKWLKPEESE